MEKKNILDQPIIYKGGITTWRKLFRTHPDLEEIIRAFVAWMFEDDERVKKGKA